MRDSFGQGLAGAFFFASWSFCVSFSFSIDALMPPNFFPYTTSPDIASICTSDAARFSSSSMIS